MPTKQTSEKSDLSVIPYGRQDITDDDIAAVDAVLRSDFLTQGPAIPKFEAAVADRVGAKFATASNSATSSLHLACLALGIGPGDLVWTTPVTFVASANCARYCGADIDFIDIDRRTYNLSVDHLERKLKQAAQGGRLPKTVIPVHLAGQPADMAAIRQLSQEYGFSIIEDASHAIGGRYRDKQIGSGTHSDVTVFSFHPVKIITSGEGGMALSNDVGIASRIARLNSHGITRNPGDMVFESDGPWYYEQIELGYNYRMTDIQAALGLSQLQRIDKYVARRHQLAARYDRLLDDLPLVTPWRDPNDYSGFHLYIIRLQLSRLKRSRREIFEYMRAAGVLVNLHYIPLYRQPDFIRYGFDKGNFPESEAYYREAITLPLFPRMREEEQNRIVATLKEVLV